MFTEGNKKFLYITGGIFVVFILIIILVFAKSGSKKTTSSSSNTLTIWGTSDDASAYSDIISNFQQSNSSVKVTYVKKDSSTYLTDSLAEIAAGKGPDVWIVPNTWLPKYHDQMTAMPANLIADKKNKKSDVEVYQSTFPKVVASDNIINNQIYGMPITADTLELYYNTSLFSNTYGVLTQQKNPNQTDLNILNSGPKNWDEFVRAVQLLTQKSGSTVTQSGAALGTSNISNANDILTLLMEQDGAKMTSDDLSSAQFQTSQNIYGGGAYPGTQALSFYNSFANPSNANYTWSDSLGDSVNAFAQGKSAMMIGYASQANDIKRINPNLKYQTTNVPQVTATTNQVNFASYNTFTVTKAAKDSTLAWNFIELTAFTNNGSAASSYLANANQKSVILSRLDSNSPLITAKNWYVPDPIQTPQIFLQMIKTVNGGGVAQTAVENAASQVTTLLTAIKQ